MDFSDEDIQLMLRFKNGEESCFEQLVERHKARVFNVVYRFLGSHQDAEDAAQEVFIKVYNAKNSYQPKAKFTTWLYTICKNTCFNELRKRKSVCVSIDDTIRLEEDTVPLQIADSSALSPADSALNKEKAFIVKNAIDSLSVSQKMAVILCRYDRLSYEEIAQIMHCSVIAVKSLLHRAKVQLKDKLKYYIENKYLE